MCASQNGGTSDGAAPTAASSATSTSKSAAGDGTMASGSSAVPARGSAASAGSRSQQKPSVNGTAANSAADREHDGNESSGAGGEVYCVCRTADVGGTMLSCDFCEDWFHVSILLHLRNSGYLIPTRSLSASVP